MKKLFLALSVILSLSTQAFGFSNIYIVQRINHMGKGCDFALANIDSRYAIEWRYSDFSHDWMNTNVGSGKPIPKAYEDTCFAEICSVKPQHFAKHRSYYFAARQFIDENNNGKYDDGEFARDWSYAAPIQNSPDYINRCSFE